MNDPLSELRDACRGAPPPSDAETIRRGRSTWFRGRPAPAPEGTVALADGDARIIIDERDVRATRKHGDHFHVEVSAEANVLLRIDKLLKATAQPRDDADCGCGDDAGGTGGTGVIANRRGGKKGDITVDIGPIELCDLVCGDFVLGGIVFHVCIPVNCRIL